VGLGAGAASAAASKAQNQAKGELLKRSDLPKGWSAIGTTSTGSGGLPSGDALATCDGVSASVINLSPPNVSSPQFSFQSQVRTVTSTISLYASSRAARSQYAAYTNPKMPGCLSQLFNGPAKAQLNSSFGHGLSAGTIAVTRLSSSYAPKNATAIALYFTVSGGVVSSTPGEIIFILGIKGSHGMEITLTSVESTFPASLSKHVATVQLGRL
jgi:hypothetical protein